MVNVEQDVVFLMESPKYPYDISAQGVNMALNRFCIDEEMAFESSGVFYLRYKYHDDYEATGKG